MDMIEFTDTDTDTVQFKRFSDGELGVENVPGNTSPIVLLNGSQENQLKEWLGNVTDHKWQKMPDTFGWWFFCYNSCDKSFAAPVRVERVHYNDEVPFFRRADNKEPIRKTEGWWLKIEDHRETAEAEDEPTA